MYGRCNLDLISIKNHRENTKKPTAHAYFTTQQRSTIFRTPQWTNTQTSQQVKMSVHQPKDTVEWILPGTNLGTTKALVHPPRYFLVSGRTTAVFYHLCRPLANAVFHTPWTIIPPGPVTSYLSPSGQPVNVLHLARTDQTNTCHTNFPVLCWTVTKIHTKSIVYWEVNCAHTYNMLEYTSNLHQAHQYNFYNNEKPPKLVANF